ncbi:MAG: response regulator transcription factor [Bacteroidetes bacterium]|nr:response regulator transcription factor [Bacteroidota bacterium]
MSDLITVVIADDHPVFRHGLRDIIETDASMRVIAEAGDGKTALKHIRTELPTIAVLDLDMPEINGLDVTKQICEEDLPTSVLILTIYEDEHLYLRAMDLGAMGYLIKETAIDDIAEGIRSVANGESFVSPRLGRRVTRKDPSLNDEMQQRLGLLKLTPSERRVLRLVAKDLTTAEIADELIIAMKTVEKHRTNISRKLHLSGHYSLQRFALQHKEHI